jgi:hypothetical protein
MFALFPPGSQCKIDFGCSFSVDHILYDALPVKEHIEVITSQIYAQDVEHKQDKPGGFPIVVVVLENFFVVADNNSIGGSEKGHHQFLFADSLFDLAEVFLLYGVSNPSAAEDTAVDEKAYSEKKEHGCSEAHGSS